jgi:hypothetical protein
MLTLEFTPFDWFLRDYVFRSSGKLKSTSPEWRKFADSRDLPRTINPFNPSPDFQLVQAIGNMVSSYHHAVEISEAVFARVAGARLLHLRAFDRHASTDVLWNVHNAKCERICESRSRDSNFDLWRSLAASITYYLPSAGSWFAGLCGRRRISDRNPNL